jgi:hypothetical protein
MSLSASTVWEVRPSAGSDTNGGGFVTGASGTDWTQQNAAKYALTNGTTAGTTTVLTSSASSDMVGNIAYIAGGTGSITGNWYQITAQSTGVSITVDRSTGLTTGTGVTVNIGGALSTLVQMFTIWTATNTNTGGQTAWVKASGTTIINSGNGLTFEPTNYCYMYGYTSTRGDNGQVTLQGASGLGSQMVTAAGMTLANFLFDGGKLSSVSGFNCLKCTFVSFIVNCTFQNCAQSAINFSNNSNIAWQCTATNCGGGGNSVFNYSANNGPNAMVDCVATGCPAVGFNGFGGALIRCISANNTGSTSYGIQVGGSDDQMVIDHCLIYKNGGDGIRATNSAPPNFMITNCIIYGNGGYGINNNSSALNYVANYNAFGSNTSGARNNFTAGTNDVTLTGDPTTNGSSNVFTLNNTAGAGAACRGAGYPG